jgi:hypothetical protein
MNQDGNFTFSIVTAGWDTISRIFDPLVERLAVERSSISEAEWLAEYRELGEEISLRDDARFRPTPYGRWMLADWFLANDWLAGHLRRLPNGVTDLPTFLTVLDEQVGRRTVFCPGDPRFRLTGTVLRLAESELSEEPLIEEMVREDEQYRTHLPLWRLRQAAYLDYLAGPGDDILALAETPRGWIRVELGRPLDRSMFIVRIEDESMNGGGQGLRQCDYAVFNARAAGSSPSTIRLVRGVLGATGAGFHYLRRVEWEETGRIRLRPDNPDRVRFPELGLNPAEGDELVLVAELLEVLRPEQYERAPRQDGDPRTRSLEECRVIGRRVERLVGRCKHFFSAPDDDVETPGVKAWAVAAICDALERGGLQLEIGPIKRFWSFVNELRLVGEGWEKTVSTVGLRERPVRIEMAPWTERLRWEAVGFERDAMIDLALLELEGLAVDRVTVFRIGEDGVGRRAGERIEAGRAYRLLIPPALGQALLDPPALVELGGGWRLWELEVPAMVPPALIEWLSGLGLQLREETVNLDWVIVPPVEWRRNWQEKSYPRFLAESGAVIRVTGPRVERVGDAILLLLTPDGHKVYPLPEGREHLLRFSDLVPGSYGIEIVHQRHDIGVERCYFEVVEAAPASPAAGCRIGIGSEWYELTAGETVTLPAHDLARLHEGAGLAVVGPPGWPLRLFWQSLERVLIYETTIGEQWGGEVAPLLEAIHRQRQNAPTGELLFDLQELGQAVLPHRAGLDIDGLREAVAELVLNLAPTIRRRPGEYLTTIPVWYQPLLRLLGYTLADCPVPETTLPIRVQKLFHDESTPTGYVRRPARLLFLCHDLRVALDDDWLAWMDQVATAQQLHEMLLSDGLRWTVRRRGSRLPMKIRDLEWIVDDHDLFVDFLREAGEGL